MSLILPLALVAQSCGVRDESGRPPSVFDSPEIPRWQIPTEPEILVGGRYPRDEYLMERVTGGRILSDGRFMIADRGSQTIRIFSAGGEFLRRMGGVGDGPGEFRALRWVGLGEDGKILAWDILHARMTVFDDTGRVLGTFFPDLGWSGVIRPGLVGHLPGGSVFSVRRTSGPTTAGVEGQRLDSMAYYFVPDTGRGADLLFLGRGRETYWRE